MVKKEPNIRELTAIKERLLQSLRLFDLVASAHAPDFLKRIDLPAVKELIGGTDLPWGEEGLYTDSKKLLTAVRKSEEGQKLLLSTDVDVLKQVSETGKDQVHKGPLGFSEAVFPVKVRGHVVHCLWSGKFREHPFASEEITEVARLAGISLAEAQELAKTVPVLSKKQVDRAVAFCGRFRGALEQAITNHLHSAELTQQLVQSERTHSVGTLSGGVAHHFNNLLSVILGYSSFVLNREHVSDEAADALHKIAEAAQRGRRLTEEILAFLGSEVEEEAPCDVHETVNNVLSLLESKTGSHVRVQTHLDAKASTVLAPPSSIRQIVFNLLTNAIDSMPSGGALTVSTVNTHVTTEAGRQEFFQLEVADSSGVLPVGVRPVAAGKDRVDTPVAGDRIGFKLSSVYGMVGRLDGTVLVSSEPGTLTRVQVLLPTVRGREEVQEEKKARRHLAPSRIWVVDDDAIFREMCRQVLSDEGHTVNEMAGGREFQEKWRKGGAKPDLILMDFSMPEYNGLQLCEWLRNEGSKIPVILVSGFSSSLPDISKALKIRKTFFLQKPFSFREMTDTVTVALGETLIGE
jgi:signal transduction histidine kinase/ActR/RegA family two-component response regulator